MLALLASILCLAVQPEADLAWRFDRPVDPGYEDTGILGESFRLPMADLRQPDGWDRVYRMEGRDGAIFARRNGGVTAVFPQSDYINTRDGSIPTVPAGTIYVIGEPAPWLLRQLGLEDGYEELAPRGRLDLSLPARVFTPPPAPPEDTDSALEAARRSVSMWYNDGVRAGRVSARLAEAAAANDR